MTTSQEVGSAQALAGLTPDTVRPGRQPRTDSGHHTARRQAGPLIAGWDGTTNRSWSQDDGYGAKLPAAAEDAADSLAEMLGAGAPTADAAEMRP